MTESSPCATNEKKKKTKKSVTRLSAKKRSLGGNKGMSIKSHASNRSTRRKGKKGSKKEYLNSADKKLKQKAHTSNSLITSLQPTQLKSIEQKSRQRAGDFAIPKRMEMKQNDVNDEDVRSFLIEQKKKKKVSKDVMKLAATDFKSQLKLDRLAKKQFVRKEECEMAQCDDSYWTTLQNYGNEEKMVDDRIDNYDYVPKVDDVLKMSAQNVYSSTGFPYWMDYLEPMPDDIKHVEPSCPVGSDQIEMYHEKKIVLRAAPLVKITLDQWQYSRRLKDRDKAFFSYPLVFSNTLRSLINVEMEGKKLRKESKEGADELLITALDDRIVWINLEEMKCHYYDRSDPFGSIRCAPN